MMGQKYKLVIDSEKLEFNVKLTFPNLTWSVLVYIDVDQQSRNSSASKLKTFCEGLEVRLNDHPLDDFLEGKGTSREYIKLEFGETTLGFNETDFCLEIFNGPSCIKYNFKSIEELDVLYKLLLDILYDLQNFEHPIVSTAYCISAYERYESRKSTYHDIPDDIELLRGKLDAISNFLMS